MSERNLGWKPEEEERQSRAGPLATLADRAESVGDNAKHLLETRVGAGDVSESTVELIDLADTLIGFVIQMGRELRVAEL